MSGEFEAAGAAATAGLAAAAIEGREPHEGAHGPCANCGADLTGRFCASCGQPAHVHRSLLHLLEETLHGLFHFDTKAWRTLPKLAFRPGTLTREYIDGKRARYVSPLALFLFTVFLMFAAMAVTGGFSLLNVAEVNVEVPTEANAAARAEGRAELEHELESARAKGETARIAALERSIALLDTGGRIEGEGVVEAIAGAVRDGDLNIETGNAKLDEKIAHKLENPEFLIYKIEQAAYKLAFLLIPISLPLISLLFLWKKGVTLFDHTVFALYSLSFMCLFFLVMALLSPLAFAWHPFSEARSFVITFLPPVHMFFHLRGAYRLNWFSSLWRTLVLLVMCGLALLIFLALITIVGLLG